MTDEEYYNPWLASRWLAFWFELMQHDSKARAIRRPGGC